MYGNICSTAAIIIVKVNLIPAQHVHIYIIMIITGFIRRSTQIFEILLLWHQIRHANQFKFVNVLIYGNRWIWSPTNILEKIIVLGLLYAIGLDQSMLESSAMPPNVIAFVKSEVGLESCIPVPGTCT